ncbi:MAG: type II toxin-antitoxin system VapC family toxin [Desertifilum sp.]|nr:type II toxin-antitoxin system VapC family toxin [Desertifilum sp.]
MIVLDTHIWVWWVQGDSRLTPQHQQWLDEYQTQGLGVSIYSCWEVAKLVEKGRLMLPAPIAQWFEAAIAYPGVRILDLTLPIAIQSTQLVGFHNDPADQIIVATAKVHNCPLLTADQKILGYPDVQTLQ